MRALSALVAAIVAGAVTLAQTGRDEPVRVMSAGALAAAHLKIVPEFERVSGLRVATLATSTGVGADAIAARVRRGEPVDVVILARAALDELIREGLIREATRVDLARSRIGIAVRRGAPKPDIRSVDALRQTLIGAKSVAISAQVSGL
jgi:molybdate transport system substrate-binding protein